MIPKNLSESVQFTVDSHNTITAVVVEPDLWRTILSVLEESEEREFAAMLREHTPGPVDPSSLLLPDSNEDWA